MDVCPLCNGDGRRIIIKGKNPRTNLLKVVTEWCICEKSRYISRTYDMLSFLGDAYLPLEEIDKNLIFDYENLSKSPNLYITSTSLSTFNFHVKSFIIKYHFISNPPNIYYCKAIDLLKRFYVKQEDGSSPSLSDLNHYDLLIFTLDTKEKNDQLGTCVAQVVYNRDCVCKPTWIYLPELSLLENARELTDDLKTYLDPKSKKYTKISIASTGIEIKSVKTVVQKKAESFRR